MIPDELKRAKPLTGKERLGAMRDSEYMGAEDIDPGSEPVLTIDHIYYATVTLQRGKENKDVITFREETVPGIKRVRPLIVNATNRKTLRKIYKAVTAENLEGKRIQLYLDNNVRDPSTGDKVDGIRIRPKVPTAKSAEVVLCEICKKPITAFGQYSAEQMVQISKERFNGRCVCATCGAELKKQMEAEAAATIEPAAEDKEAK